jgi:Kef-type K+ transport system membrane component KefB
VLLLQLAVIVTACLVLGRLVVFVKQTRVIGEMIAGLLLGPSCLGWLAPAAFASLFPPESMQRLELLSQACLIAFMCLLGWRVSSSHRGGAAPRAVVVLSLASVATPFALGLAVGWLLYVTFAPPDSGITPFVLFVATAMSMTAFPVLARIIDEFRLIGTRLGTTAIACAAFDDVLGWLLLAGVLWLAHVERGSSVARHMLLFAAFAIGLALPRAGVPGVAWLERMERYALPWLLPLFFAFTGLRTQIQLIDSPRLWMYTGLILIAAIVGKIVPSVIAASAMGLPKREAWSIGVLLNTRGLIELVILSIGLDARILTPQLYSMFVVMTLVTTLMTSPILARLVRDDG